MLHNIEVLTLDYSNATAGEDYCLSPRGAYIGHSELLVDLLILKKQGKSQVRKVVLKRRKRVALIAEEDRCDVDLVKKISQTVGISFKEDGALRERVTIGSGSSSSEMLA
jgi:hypothetical protein